MKKITVILISILFIIALFGCSKRDEAENKDVTVSFVTDGTKVREVVNRTVEQSPTTEKEGYVFEGWYAEDTFVTRINFPFRAFESCKLYAKWIDKEVGNEEIVYKRLSDGNYSVERCYTQCPTIWIPDRHEGGKVVVLEEGFLRYKTAVTVIHIGKNIRSIEENFSRCLALAAFDVDQSNAYWISDDGVLFSLDKTVLYDYPTAKEGDSYTIPSSVVSVGEGAFAFNMFLSTLSVGKKLEASHRDFKKMENLARIDVADGNTSFRSEEGVLYSTDRKKLLLFPVRYAQTDYAVLSGTTEVEEGAFSDSSIVNLNINKELSVFYAPENVPYLQSYTVESGNAYFASRDGVLFIDGGATLYLVPQGRTGEFTVPEGTTTVYDFSFGGCAVTKVILPPSVTSIEKYAFRNCFSLENVTFAEGSLLEKIEESAFSRCSALKKVVLTTRIPPQTGRDLFDSCGSDLTVVVPAYTGGLYAALWDFCADKISATGEAATQYTVTFDSLGGTSVSSVRATFILEEPETTKTSDNEKEYYIFLGWYDNPEGTGQKISFPYAITEDVTLYAAWDLGLRDLD